MDGLKHWDYALTAIMWWLNGIAAGIAGMLIAHKQGWY